MNGEKYSDPTADHAVKSAMRTPDHVIKVINMMKSILKEDRGEEDQKR